MEATLVEVEVALGNGLPRTVIVGLPDAALNEARDRCRAAMAHLGVPWPAQLVTVNLSPATLPKSGSHYDLAIAAGVLCAAGEVPPERLAGCVVLGELALDGRVRPVRGVLPSVLAAQRAGCHHAVVPAAQAAEARLVEGLEVVGVETLAELVAVLRGAPPPPRLPEVAAPADPAPALDLADVAGQLEARWAVEVAAAGGHHLHLHGPPGVGKTLLAERLPGLLPELGPVESLEVSALRSVCGLGLEHGLVRRAPFAAPHHTATVAALVGGGSRIASPGAVSLAHHGILFLDEAPEFSSAALEALRTPLESGQVVLIRSQAQTTYPARFQLVLAANPCPCGNRETSGMECTCSSTAVRRYRDRLSGPILDRVDITCHLRPMTQSYLRASRGTAEDTATVAARVLGARERQRARLAGLPWTTNAAVPGPWLRRELPLPEGVELVDQAVARGRLSARGVDKVMRIAWTVADLAGADRPARAHLLTALAMRSGGPDLEKVSGCA
ncbi:YifB family Mg chelatase-like AAA ATPase [Propioniciclava soli]|uniref:YifB family Mg chelatase-like AAA ATPase n=1 Tax=Propioniciclava soli TaxID=2775081 RepID=A0ABZ3CCF2_9ACTN